MAETKTVKKTTRTRKTAVKAEKTTSTEANSALNIPVYDLTGKEEKTVELPKELFDVEESPRLVAQYVRVYLANRRQGTASTKQRSEVVGTTKKIYRQKGTGGARHGSKKAPIYVGGGVVGGPQPSDHSLKINKKQKRKALLSVLTTKAKERSIVALGKDVVDMKPKTKEFMTMLKTIGANDQKIMLVVAQSPNEGLKLSTRNLGKVLVVSPANVNPYNLLVNKKILFTEDALTVLSTLYLKK